MSINKTVKTLAQLIGVPLVVTAGALTGLNFYRHHNVHYELGGNKLFKKADGLFGYTVLEIDKEGSVGIDRYSFANTIFYTDKDGDGNVDNIFQWPNLFLRGSHLGIFERGKHLNQYPIVFQDADRDFREQMQRFKPYINR